MSQLRTPPRLTMQSDVPPASRPGRRPRNRDARANDAMKRLVLANPEWTAGMILDALNHDEKLEGLILPSDKSVRRELQKARARRAAGQGEEGARPWRLTDSEHDPVGARLILETIASSREAVILAWWPSRRHAELIALVRRAAPDLPRPLDAFLLAWIMIDGSDGLTAATYCLATRPWATEPAEPASEAEHFGRRLWEWVSHWTPAAHLGLTKGALDQPARDRGTPDGRARAARGVQLV